MQNQNNTEPTNGELMEAIQGLTVSNKDLLKGFQDLSATMNDFATDTGTRLGNLEKDMKEVKQDVAEVKQDVAEVKQDVRGVKSSMVTKSYLDDKFSDRLGDVKSMVRKEDNKVNFLVESLTEDQILKEEDKKRIISMGPFIQPSI